MVKNPLANTGDIRDTGLTRVRKIPWRRAWQLTLILLAGESHGQRSLVGYGPQDLKESDTSEVTYHARIYNSNDRRSQRISYLLLPFSRFLLVFIKHPHHEGKHFH